MAVKLSGYIFLIDDKFLKYNDIWSKVFVNNKKDLDSEPVYNKFLKAK